MMENKTPKTLGDFVRSRDGRSEQVLLALADAGLIDLPPEGPLPLPDALRGATEAYLDGYGGVWLKLHVKGSKEAETWALQALEILDAHGGFTTMRRDRGGGVGFLVTLADESPW